MALPLALSKRQLSGDSMLSLLVLVIEFRMKFLLIILKTIIKVNPLIPKLTQCPL